MPHKSPEENRFDQRFLEAVDSDNKTIKITGSDLNQKEYSVITIFDQDHFLAGGNYGFTLIGQLHYPDNNQDAPVVIKIFAPEPHLAQLTSASVFQESFQNEVEDLTQANQILRPDQNPETGVPLFYGVSEIHGLPVMVREFLPLTLKDSHLTPQKIARMVQDLAAVSETLYRETGNTLVTTDLNDDNIGIRENGSFAIIDFGNFARMGTSRHIEFDPAFYPFYKDRNDINRTASLDDVTYALAMLAYKYLGGEMLPKDVVQSQMLRNPPIIKPIPGVSDRVMNVLKRAAPTISYYDIYEEENRDYPDEKDLAPFSSPLEFAQELSEALLAN